MESGGNKNHNIRTEETEEKIIEIEFEQIHIKWDIIGVIEVR